MTKFAYAISIAAMTLTALVVAPPAAFAGEATVAAVAATAAPSLEVGRMLYASDGKRLGAVYKLKADGSPQVILDGKLVTIPASTIVGENGKLSTSLKKSDIKAR